jgi:hypothetical protein
VVKYVLVSNDTQHPAHRAKYLPPESILRLLFVPLLITLNVRKVIIIINDNRIFWLWVIEVSYQEATERTELLCLL